MHNIEPELKEKIIRLKLEEGRTLQSLEDEFGVFIDGMEILPENFVSVETIQALVDRSEKQ
mgnify:CR=1 FL=1